MGPNLSSDEEEVFSGYLEVSRDGTNTLTPRSNTARRRIDTTLIKDLSEAESKVYFTPVSVELCKKNKVKQVDD